MLATILVGGLFLFLIIAFGEAGLYIVSALIGISITVFIISKICEIARNTRK